MLAIDPFNHEAQLYAGTAAYLRQAFEPNDAMVALARRVAQVAGLVFTAIDMRQTPDGELVVFEANSSPDFTADEAQAGHPLSDCLARLLARVD